MPGASLAPVPTRANRPLHVDDDSMAHKPISEQSPISPIWLKNILIAADDALKFAAEAGDKPSEEVDKRFGDVILPLIGYQKVFSSDSISGPIIGGIPSKIQYAFKSNFHGKPRMGSPWQRRRRVVKFHLLGTLPDPHPIIVELILSLSPSIQEILWNFSRFEGEKRLTLKENPHFYAELPTSPEAYGDSFKIDPIEDFRHGDEFYVLTDQPEPVHIMTDQVSLTFGNSWCPKEAVIFKDIYGKLMGEHIVKASVRGTHSSCRFCMQFPVSTLPRASGNRYGLQPIITEGLPWMGWKYSTGCLPMHSSVDFGLVVCIGRAESDSLLPVPLPPTSEQPGYRVAYKTHIHDLDNDSLLQIFSHYRQKNEDDWNLRLEWRRLAHICRRWRYLIYDSRSHLDICLLLTNDSPSIDTLDHLPPLPLLIDYSVITRTIARKDEDNIRLGLRQPGHIYRVVLRAPSSNLRIWLEPMNKHFPRLGDLSLLSTTIEETNLMLPENFQAPDLRRLALHGIGLPTGLTFLSSVIALSTLSLTNIGASYYFPPGHLVTQLQGLPHLEELSIGFAIPIPLPSSERELLPPPIPAVTLPALRRLTFRGVGVYLENLVAQINTPLLERLSLTLFFELAFSFVNLTEFIHRTKGFGCPSAEVIFNKDGASIDASCYGQHGIGKLNLHVNCERLDWQIDSATQVCSALGNVMSAVEGLTLDLRVDGMLSDWENTVDNVLWHELLLPFIGVKTLHIGSSLALELSQALESVRGALVLELMPELQEIEIPLKIDHATNAFSMFMKTRESVGRPIQLLVPPEIAFGPSLSTETVTELAPNSLAAQAGPRPGLDDAINAERKVKKRWQARALGLIGRLRGKNQN